MKYGNVLALFLAIRSTCSSLFSVQLRQEQYKNRSMTELASFTDPTPFFNGLQYEKGHKPFLLIFHSHVGVPENKAVTERELSNEYDRELCM